MLSYIEIGKSFKVSKDKAYFSVSGNGATHKFKVDSSVEANNWEKAIKLLLILLILLVM